jgi:membrane protein implicated in regulation of membrane protease activity
MVIAVLDLGIDLDVWPWIWLGTAVIFALVELFVVGGSFVILPWAASAFVAAILAFYDVAIEIQWAVFVFGGALLFAVLYRWAQRFMKEHTMAPGVGADRVVGLTAIVTTPIEPDDTTRAGRVSVDGEVWGAVTDGAYRLAKGAKVRVLAMKGTRVVVAPLAPESRPNPSNPSGDESSSQNEST